MGLSIRFDRKYLNVHPKSGKIYFTYNSIEKLPEWPEGPLLEIINGELFILPSPSIKHQEISLNLAALLKQFVEEHELGKILVAPVDVVLSDDNAVIPDIIFIKKERKDIIKEKNIHGIPDFVVEILSTNKKRDLKDKMELYETYQLQEYWVINPFEDEVMIYSFNRQEGKFNEPARFKKAENVSSQVIKDFQVKVIDIFS